MLELDHLLDGLPENVTVTFFAAFSRFEYALMQCRFLTARARAEPNWERLAATLGADFFQEAADHVPTLVNDPPKKLIVRHGHATFDTRPTAATNTVQLLRYARQVRNNLF